MSETPGDFALLDQLKDRDPEAIAQLYDRFSASVYALFLRTTRDESVAEDLVQELFLRVWNRAADFDRSRGSVGVWILSIARNMGIDYLRSAHARFVHRLQPIEIAEDKVSLHDPGRETAIDQDRTVHSALAQLNQKQQMVLELAYFEGLSQTEIAARLHEPLGTVKSWTRSALQNLRVALKIEPPSKEVR